MKRVACSFAAIALLAGFSSAHAEAPWLADFKKADLNDSGGLSQVELDKAKAPPLQLIKTSFKAIDADGDGHVTASEYARFLDKADDAFAAQFKKADLNDSGGLSAKELEKASGKEFDAIEKNFAAIDADKDGQVSYAEYQKYQAVAAKAAPAASQDGCLQHCGVVVDVDRYKTEGEGSMLGAIAGGVAGGLLGNQVGGGTGKTIATVGGVAGGAYAGHEVEKHMKSKKMVKVTVKFDDGEQRDFRFEAEKSPFRKGERVQLSEGHLRHYKGE